MNFKVEDIVRKNIIKLKPYSSARDEFKGKANVWFDANESPFSSNINRYPDPYQTNLKKVISTFKNIDIENIFLGNGSDEVIDLLFRVFCEPGKDKIILFTPTYGMYEVTANINDVEVIKIPLNSNFQIDNDKIQAVLNDRCIKIIFICSPNNPTGNIIHKEDILSLARSFYGLVVVDEAYIDFSLNKSILKQMNNIPNLVVMQTFSKAWGMAAARLGMAFAHKHIIDYLTKVKAPYNVNTLTQEAALEALKKIKKINIDIQKILSTKQKLIDSLKLLRSVEQVFPSDANFLLVKFKNAKAVYKYLVNKGIILRDRTNAVSNCLRITVGTEKQTNLLIDELRKYDELQILL